MKRYDLLVVLGLAAYGFALGIVTILKRRRELVDWTAAYHAAIVERRDALRERLLIEEGIR